jgi:hypothetical protein
MTFLAPAAFLGTLLLTIPVIVHLLKPRKMRQTPFSSLRWLKETHQRLSRRIQWHQWLLFLLRAGCILLLVLALTRPLVGMKEIGRPTDRFVIVDVGRAMAYEARGLPTPLAKAQELAADLLQKVQPGDRTAVILAGSAARLVCPLTGDAAAHLPTVQAAGAEAADCRLGPALAVVRSLVGQGNPARDVEVVFLTSNRQRSWDHGEIQTFLGQLSSAPHVQVVEVGPGAVQNGWIAGARLHDLSEADHRLLRVQLGYAGDVRQERAVRLTGIAGVADDQQSVTLQPGQAAVVNFRIPAHLGLSGQVAELRLEPTDALQGDDSYYLPLDVPWALQLLVVEPETQGKETHGAGHYLRTAQDALSATGNRALELVSRSTRSVSPADIRKADVIFLAGVPELTDAAVESLSGRVRSGAGLVIFLGPGLNPGFYNDRLFRPVQPAEGLLPAPLQSGPGMIQTTAAGILTSVRWDHPLLARLHDPRHGDFGRVRFRRLASLAAPPRSSDTVLARIDDDQPALIERVLGAGRVLVWNTTADDAWSDLPQKDSFVYLVDGMISYLCAGGRRRQFNAGEAITLPVPHADPGEEVSLLTPGGRQQSMRLDGQGGRAVLHLEHATEVGVYRLERSGKDGLVFAVNTDRRASSLTPMDGSTLETWWSPAAVEVLGSEEAAERYKAATGGLPLWPALVLLACLLLLAETIYVYRLCPRLNPTATESVVPRRGLLRPLSEKVT